MSQTGSLLCRGDYDGAIYAFKIVSKALVVFFIFILFYIFGILYFRNESLEPLFRFLADGLLWVLAVMSNAWIIARVVALP